MVNLYTTDRRFQVERMIDWQALSSVRTAETETYGDLLVAVGKLAGEEIAPRARQNNEVPYRVENGKLVWPQGIRESYDVLRNAGLNAATVDEQYGGLGLPFCVNVMMLEMLFQADAGFTTIPGLQTGVADVLNHFASEEQKRRYLPLLTSGAYTAGMDLSEAQAGSDLGGIKTKATPTGEEGVARITGEKIFITNGGGDLQIVLVREVEGYEETRGTMKGLSMYLVPREIEGRNNGVEVVRVENKIGLHSSPTCVVRFDDALGELVGEKGQGFKYMLLLMNSARLSVAGQALGTLEGAYAEALSYAQQRKQFGRPIAEISQVQRMLKEIKVSTEAIRAVLYPAAFAVDMERGLQKKIQQTSDAQERESLEQHVQQYAHRAAVLTFGTKYYAAERAVELARKALQIHGGMGYMSETPVVRFVLDSFITTIYEGTSEIQAGQLLDGALKAEFGLSSRSDIRRVLDEVEQGLEKLSQNGECSAEERGMRCLATEVRRMSHMVRKSSRLLAEKGMEFAGEGIEQKVIKDLLTVRAKELAEMTVEVYAGFQLLRQAQIDERKKAVAAEFIEEELVPNTLLHARRVRNLNKGTLERYRKILSED